MIGRGADLVAYYPDSKTKGLPMRDYSWWVYCREHDLNGGRKHDLKGKWETGFGYDFESAYQYYRYYADKGSHVQLVKRVETIEYESGKPEEDVKGE